MRRGKKNRSPRRRLDLTAMREALADGKVWVGLGIVTAVEGPHYRIDEGDVVIDVLTVPDEELVTCRLSGGVWQIPKEGTEVPILVPLGEYTFSPIALPQLSSGALPDGVALGATVIADDEVLVHDGSGGAVALALKSDVDELRTKLLGHSHDDPSTGVVSKPNNGAAAPDPAVGTGLSVDAMAGTTILKGK